MHPVRLEAASVAVAYPVVAVGLVAGGFFRLLVHAVARVRDARKREGRTRRFTVPIAGVSVTV